MPIQFLYTSYVTIGFAGKRKHEKLELVADRLESLFKALDQKLNNRHLHFVTGLADGADLIATDTFLKYFENDIKENKKSCGAILPFAKSTYLDTIHGKKEFERLCANCSQVLELDGKNEKGTPRHISDRAYQQQGRVLGYISDIFLAVAPKSEKGKTGGTKESLISVLTLRKPVILLNLDDGKFYLYQTLEEWFGEDNAVEPEQIADMLFEPQFKEPDEKKKEEVGELDQTYMSKLIFMSRKNAWLLFEKFFKQRRKATAPIADLHFVNPLQENLYRKQLKLDDIAAHFQYQYRGGYVLTYILAFIAVMLAIISLVVFSEMFVRNAENLAMVNILIIIGLFKLVIIIAMYINTRNINRSAYNPKAIYYRYAAERFRINYFMSLLGVLSSPRPHLGNHSKKRFAKYTGEAIYQEQIATHLKDHYHIAINKEGLQKFIRLIKNNWVKGQKKYHLSAMVLMGRMDKKFLKLPGEFSIAVLMIVAFDLIIGGLFGYRIICIPETVRHPYDHFALPILLGFTALLPAIVSTLNGIHSQSETHRLSVRSELMVDELEAHIERIRQVEHCIEDNNEGSDFFTVLKLMDELASTLTDEVAEWSLLYEKRVDEPG